MMYWSEDLKEAKYWMRSHLDADAALLQGEGDEGIMVRARTLYFVSLLSLVCKWGTMASSHHNHFFHHGHHYCDHHEQLILLIIIILIIIMRIRIRT